MYIEGLNIIFNTFIYAILTFSHIEFPIYSIDNAKNTPWSCRIIEK
jgi:hypothetical protein